MFDARLMPLDLPRHGMCADILLFCRWRPSALSYVILQRQLGHIQVQPQFPGQVDCARCLYLSDSLSGSVCPEQMTLGPNCGSFCLLFFALASLVVQLTGSKLFSVIAHFPAG